MLGTKTKQVNSYGRRGSRIVNVSHRKGRGLESADSSSDIDISPPHPLRRENAIVISPTKPRVGFRRLHGSGRSPRSSPLAPSRDVQLKRTQDVIAKRLFYKKDQDVPVREPLTPLRVNGKSTNCLPSSSAKSKTKASNIKPARTSLRQRLPTVAVDILLFDDSGNVLTQERRLSYTDVQVNQLCAAAGKRKMALDALLPSPSPIAISDDSDLEVSPPIPVAKRLNRRPRTIVISSDESEADDKNTSCSQPPAPSAKSCTKSKMPRTGAVVPHIPSPETNLLRNPSSPHLALTPPKPPSLPPTTFRCGSAAVPPLGLPVPTARPRQLTPIRGSSRSSCRPPPTPSTPTEVDLSLDLAQLDLSDVTEIDHSTFIQPGYLVPLLNECAQTYPYEFSAFIETFPFDPIVQSSAKDEDAKFRKIGEASYSEVFGIGDVVLKIIPVQSGEELMIPEVVEMPAPSDAKDVLKEIIVTREIGEICDRFVNLLKTYVVKGKYPSLLLDLWDEYNKRKGSESIRPDSFGLAQVYVIIVLPNGGPDLETFAFKNGSKSGWHQACGVFWQVARALEQAEHLVNFEHRDLHWGQILVKSLPIKKATRKHPASRVPMDDPRFGVQVTIIDLGLSRMDAVDTRGVQTYWTPFDSEIFEGEGDYQYDAYRLMRDVIRGAWKSYHPFTNVIWLHYLVTKLLREKRLKPPGGRREGGGDNQVLSPTGYDEGECYDCLVEMEMRLGKCIASARKRQKAHRKMAALSDGPKSASDVIAYGTRRGWVR